VGYGFVGGGLGGGGERGEGGGGGGVMTRPLSAFSQLCC